MSDKWYYVEENDRKGPVEQEDIIAMIAAGQLNKESYLWTKGFENWRKLKDVEAFKDVLSDDSTMTETKYQHYVVSKKLEQIEKNKKCIYVKTGLDRGTRVQEFGPYDIEMLKKLYMHKRVNAKTLIYFPGLDCWRMLASFADFEEFFNEIPPMINEQERRKWERKPFTARLFFTSNDSVFEALCKDISMGGMQILVDNFPAKLGDQIQMNVHPENSEHQFVATAEIVRVLEAERGFSMKFVDLSKQAQKAIAQYLNEQN